MSKVLDDYNQKWFKELSPSSFFNESDLESTVQTYLSKHLINCFVLRGKIRVINNETNKVNIPDLIIVDKEYKEWYVVEVELSNHDLSHIKSQIDTFTKGIYDKSHANYLFQQNTDELDLDELNKMILRFPPKVFVIVNDFNCDWIDVFNQYDCKVGIFQIYYDRDQNRAYRFQGYFPLMKHDFGTCKFIPGLPTMIALNEKDFLDGIGIQPNEEIIAQYNGKISKWKRIDDRNSVYLECLSNTIPLDPLNKRYVITYDDIENTFHFIKA